MTQTVQRCRCQQGVGREGLIPFGEVQVAGDDGGRALIALGNQLMQVFVSGRAQWLESEVINDEYRNSTQRLKFALLGIGSAGGV